MPETISERGNKAKEEEDKPARVPRGAMFGIELFKAVKSALTSDEAVERFAVCQIAEG